jgi:hypothetical protein
LNFLCRYSAAFNPKFPKELTGNYFIGIGKVSIKNRFKQENKTVI